MSTQASPHLRADGPITSVGKSKEANKITREEQKVVIEANDSRTEHIADQLYASVAQFVEREVVMNWLQKASEDQVRTAISYTLKQIRQGTVIKNVAGYIQKMINTPLLSSNDVADTQIDQVKQQAKEQMQARMRQQAIEEAKLQALTETKHQISLQLMIDHPEWHETVRQHMQSGMFGRFYNDTLSLFENIQNPVMYGPFFQAIERLQPLVFKDLE